MMDNAILVVDDQPKNLKLIQESIGEMEGDYYMYSSFDGQDVCQLALAHQPVAVLLNWDLQAVSGLDVLYMLKKNIDTRDIPIIIMLNVMSPSYHVLKAYATTGIIDFLKAPFDFIELTAKIKSAVLLSNAYKKEMLYQKMLFEQQEKIKELTYKANVKSKELKKAKHEFDNIQNHLRKSEKLATLGELLAGITHEINNPVNFISNGLDALQFLIKDMMTVVEKYHELASADITGGQLRAEILENKKSSAYKILIEDINALFQDIQIGTERVEEIVKSMASFSRVEEREKQLISIHDCLDSALVLLTNKLKGKVMVHQIYDQSLPKVACYPVLLSQVFINIFSNAADAIEKKGNIYVNTYQKSNKTCVEIKDDGAGMSKAVCQHIFKPFYTTKPIGKGTGLGLSISHDIIEKHQGSIHVESELGNGAVFQICLPN